MRTQLRNYVIVFFTLLLISIGNQAKATHGAGGEITYKCLGGTSYELTFYFYRDCDGAPPPNLAAWNTQLNQLSANGQNSPPPNNANSNQNNGTRIWNTCNSTTIAPSWTPIDTVIVSSSCSSVKTNCEGGTAKGRFLYIYKDTVSLTSCNNWFIGAGLYARGTGINNLQNSGGVRLWMQTAIYTANKGCNNSPTFTNAPVPTVCAGDTINYLVGAIDPDGDSIFVSFVQPLKGSLSPIPFNSGYSVNFPVSPFMTIDFRTGNMTFRAPATGKYVIAIKVSEYEKGTGLLLGEIVRDFYLTTTTIGCTSNAAPMVNSGGLDPDSITGGAKTGFLNLKTKRNANLCFQVPFVDTNTTSQWVYKDSLFTTTNALSALSPGAVTTRQIRYKTDTVPAPNNTSLLPVIREICWAVPATASGFYNVSVEASDNFCPYNKSIPVNVRIDIVGDIDTVLLAPQSELCAGDGLGQLTANVIGGIGPFRFEWDSAGVKKINTTSNVLTNVPPGVNYFVTVYDSFNVSLIDTSVSAVASVGTNTVLYVNTASSKTNIGCEGGCTGTITLGNVTGGKPFPSLPKYRYKWSGTSDTTSVPDSLCQGLHYVTVSDANGCDTIYSFEILAESPEITVSIASTSDVTCKGGSDGNAIARGVMTSCGVYSNLATDTCASTSTAFVSAPGAKGNYAYASSPTSPMGGLLNAKHQYLYLASDLKAKGFKKGRISKLNWPSEANFLSLVQGLTIKMGCTDSLNLDSGFVSGLHEVYSGNLSLTVGGTSTTVKLSKVFEWDGNSNIVIQTCYSKNSSGLLNIPIKHAVTGYKSVAFVNNSTNSVCSDQSYSTSNVRPEINFLYCDPGITYSWYKLPNTTTVVDPDSNLNNVTKGTYRVIARNFAGCKDTAVAVIDEPVQVLTLAKTTIKTLSCFADTNGSVSVQVTGGTPKSGSLGYNFFWPSGVITSSDSVATNLRGGVNYVVTVSDSKGCSDVINVSLTSPDSMKITSSQVNVKCKGGNTGS
ncbi:MAG: hypothetical protein KDC83_01115, partial [Flavobacteriales bacterium]|nr:hypothetical protein [Flavobacteriales bacterium]